MKREFSRFFTRKYILIIIPILLFIIILGWSHNVFPANDSLRDSPYSDFISGLEVYDTQEELQQLYDKISAPPVAIPGMQASGNSQNIFYKTLYSVALRENLPYDSFVQIDNFKYTHFHYYAYFCMYLCMFIVLISIIIGSFYQSSDFISKTAKLVYTSGEKRTKIVARKYFVSLLSLICIVLAIDIIFALTGLKFSFTGAKYAIMYINNSLYTFTYSQYVVCNIINHMLMLILTYTLVYYLSALLKNGIITSCTFLAIALLMIFFNKYGEQSALAVFLSMFTQGLGAVYTFTDPGTFKYLALYIPFIIVPIAVAIISNALIRKSDYSR